MATQAFQLRGGRASATPLYSTGFMPQASAINSSVQNILHFAGIPGTTARSYFTPYGGKPQAGAVRSNTLESDIRNRGLGFTNKGLEQSAVQSALADSLKNVGIRNLDEIGYVLGIDRNPIFFNRASGKKIADPGQRFGKTKEGKGSQDFYIGIDEQGRPMPYNVWDPEQSDKSFIGAVLTVLSAVFAPYATSWIGTATGLGTAASGALYGAGTGALTSAATGGDVGKGALLGAIGGGLASGVGTGAGQLNLANSLGVTTPAVQAMVNRAITGGLTGAVSAKAGGGDVVKGLVGGALGGAISSKLPGGLTQMAAKPFVNQLVEQVVGSPYQSKIDKQVREMERMATLNQQELQRMNAADAYEPALDIGQNTSGNLMAQELNKLNIGGMSAGVRTT